MLQIMTLLLGLLWAADHLVVAGVVMEREPSLITTRDLTLEAVVGLRLFTQVVVAEPYRHLQYVRRLNYLGLLAALKGDKGHTLRLDCFLQWFLSLNLRLIQRLYTILYLVSCILWGLARW